MEAGQSKVVSEDEAAKKLDRIKTGIIEILSLAERKDFAGMDRVSKQVPFDQQFIGKILTLYIPDKYLGVFSNRHLDTLVKSFGLSNVEKISLNIFEKRDLLLEFKEKDEIMKNWPNRKYVNFLYKEILNNGPAEISYFILRTSGGEYVEQPGLIYNFKEGIPGYKQLKSAEDSARFVYLENGFFYGKGKIKIILSH